MIIYIGADHRGFELKENLKIFLKNDGFEVVDMGNDHYDENDDYPDFAKLVAQKVSEDPGNNRGVVICRSGVGVDVVANKFKKVRSALISDVHQAYLSRNDDDTNVLALSSEFTHEGDAREILATWLKVPFSNSEKDKRRIQKINNIER